MMRNEKKTMNFVSARGGKQHQRDIATTTVHQMIAELLPRFRTLDIEVVFRTFKKDEGAVGFCGMTDNNRTFEIEIDKKRMLKGFADWLATEFVNISERNDLYYLNGKMLF